MTEVPRFGQRRPDVDYRPRPSVYAVSIDARGRIALVDEDRSWYLPGGGLESGETEIEALHREVREECGCAARIGARLGDAIEFVVTRSGHAYEIRASFYAAELVGAPTSTWHEPDDALESVERACHGWAIQRALEQRSD